MLGSSVIDSSADPSSTETCLGLDSGFGISTSTTFFFGVMGCFVTNLEFFFSIFGATPSEIGKKVMSWLTQLKQVSMQLMIEEF